ncbi:acyltransferase [Paracoccus sp. C2R09]|nr:acyltransferase [Paracoccus sp. C2R09]MBU2957448.1 acyltransferase family protein [Paracoccus sp. C2R09]
MSLQPSREFVQAAQGSPCNIRESELIDCARVICISFMMFTHLKEYQGSILYGGQLNALGVLTNDYLGRASVPALSLVSGYLLAMGAVRKPSVTVRDFATKKARSVLAPVLVWLAASCLAASVGGPGTLAPGLGLKR